MNYNYEKSHRFTSLPNSEVWSLKIDKPKPKSLKPTNTNPKRRIILPKITEIPGVGYYSPNLSSIYSNPKIIRLRS